jgi:acylphosphatase
MKSIADILRSFDPTEDKYISREFQSYGIYLSEILHDSSHKSLYIKLAKEVPRAVLEKALSYVKDSNANSRARLFMWKLKELRMLHGVKNDQIVRVSVVVHGFVQGVGFRSYVIREAQKFRITGYAKNNEDDTVQIIGEGPRDILLNFLALVKKGPSHARVSHLSIYWEKASGEFSDFSVVY